MPTHRSSDRFHRPCNRPSTSPSKPGCEGVIAQRDMWAARAADPAIGDEASVYAHHAQNVANYIGCEAAPISVPG